MKNSEYIYVAFDSDILSELARIYENDQKGIDIRNIPKYGLMKSCGGYLWNVYQNIKQGKIRPLILNTVFHETRLVEFVRPFIKEFGYFPDYNSANRGIKRRKVKQLARAYCKNFSLSSKTLDAPMKLEYDADSDEYKPQNDAYAMAEATIEGCAYFVTGNERDYIEKKGDSLKHSRTFGIRNINIQQGYYWNTDGGDIRTSTPMSIKVFGPILKGGIEKIESNEVLNTTKASEILSDDDDMFLV